MEPTITELADRYLMQTGRRIPVTFVRGKGCLVYDDAGREYLDLVAGIAVAAFGISARTNSDYTQTAHVVKAGKPITVTSSDTLTVR